MTIDKERLKVLAQAVADLEDIPEREDEHAEAVDALWLNMHCHTILGLLAEIDRLVPFEEAYATACHVRNRLIRENEALRKDAERYRWLRQASATDGEHTHGVCIDLWENGCGFEVTLEEADAAVDTAMTTGARP